MNLTGLHLLLTYQCNLECDHCFVWSGPWQSGTMTLLTMRHILREAQDLGTIEWIFFEGGEPFLYYPIMLKGAQEAADLGFQVGFVTNSYWATTVEDAIAWLQPLVGSTQSLSVSSDIYHWNEELSAQAQNARTAAEHLGIPLGFISVAQPEASDAAAAVGQLPEGESAIMYRGRAVEKLVDRATLHPSERFTECPYENLRDPSRLHVDPFGYLHICQGISVGNLLETPLRRICEAYDPDAHPITAPLLQGGPVELARRYAVSPPDMVADACHLCDTVRRALRPQFPSVLVPDQMYGTVW